MGPFSFSDQATQEKAVIWPRIQAPVILGAS